MIDKSIVEVSRADVRFNPNPHPYSTALGKIL